MPTSDSSAAFWDSRLAERNKSVKTSFIREILKVTENPEVISFAGGLPSPEFFPVEEIKEAAAYVLSNHGSQALQYSTTEGYLPLREWIAKRYSERFGLTIPADEILITTGSQQGLDLIAKVLLDKNDSVLIEKPGYLGAIQAFSVYEPKFKGISSGVQGLDLGELKEALDTSEQNKFLYTVPNFQNPSGASYSLETRKGLGALAAEKGLLLIEDDPYGELRFEGQELPSLKCFNEDTILLGSFSKLVAPGLRLGWLCCNPKLLRRIIIMKQASDLHSSVLTQRILHRYLSTANMGEHLGRLRKTYSQRATSLHEELLRQFSGRVRCEAPKGGMFLWAEFGESVSTSRLLKTALQKQVAFVPGTAFYTDQGGDSAMRLNFTNTDLNRIRLGVTRLFDSFLSFSS